MSGHSAVCRQGVSPAWCRAGMGWILLGRCFEPAEGAWCPPSPPGQPCLGRASPRCSGPSAVSARESSCQTTCSISLKAAFYFLSGTNQSRCESSFHEHASKLLRALRSSVEKVEVADEMQHFLERIIPHCLLCSDTGA